MKKTFTKIAMTLIILAPLSVLAQWTAPSQAPTGGNASAPINVSSTAQSKSGGLWLNTGGATNGLIVQYGNTGLGVTSPGYKLDVGGKIRTSAQGYAGLGGICGAPGTQCLNFHNNGWIYVGDTSGNVYGGQGIAASNFWANSQICLAGDCRTAWPAGGVAGAAGPQGPAGPAGPTGPGTTKFSTTVGAITAASNGCTPLSNSPCNWPVTAGHRFCWPQGYATGVVVEWSGTSAWSSAEVACWY